ncbi:MAG: dihydrofolate reductase family protein [Candidatus Pelagadaptatus aseana]|uniref:dihydrofolate reductase family protein n=1 Tax=Candidatus Pelagadaptatus aseana TaxID=3120508 RepID=UPI0039B1821D
MKVTYYVAASLDGFIAKADGDVSWLDQLGISMDESGYEEFYATVDGLIMGRKTYEMIVSFGEWPYGEKPVWVCSSTPQSPMSGCNLQPETDPQTVCDSARQMGIEHLWCVGGGGLAAALLQADCLTNVSVSLMPLLLGEGIPLFAELSADHRLTLVNHRLHGSGMVQLEYRLS